MEGGYSEENQSCKISLPLKPELENVTFGLFQHEHLNSNDESEEKTFKRSLVDESANEHHIAKKQKNNPFISEDLCDLVDYPESGQNLNDDSSVEETGPNRIKEKDSLVDDTRKKKNQKDKQPLDGDSNGHTSEKELNDLSENDLDDNESEKGLDDNTSENDVDDNASENDLDDDAYEKGLDDNASENDVDDDASENDIGDQESDAENSDVEKEDIVDAYTNHFDFPLPDECTEAALNPKNARLQYKLAGEYQLNGLGQMNFFKMFSQLPDPALNKKKISEFSLKKNLLESVSKAKKQLTGLELSFLNIITNYIDVLFCKQYFKVRAKLRRSYCIHILNHILMNRARILHHNSKLKKNPEAEYRDQGFTQPTVFILVPFKGDCYHIVNQIISFLPAKCKVMNKARFEKDYGPTGKKSKNKPEDFYEIFDGNNNEDFKIGLRIQNEHVTLFSDFYKSDLIIASPMGLRPIIGDIDNKHGDADFLSSIEVFIVDRLDVLMVQNPVHLNHILLCMNHLVRKEHGNKKINYFRVREYALDKKSKYYRQNIYLSSVENHTIVYNYYLRHCFNYLGHMRSHDWVSHPIVEFIYPAMQMCFRVFDSENVQTEIQDRRKFFTEKILPEFAKDKTTVQTLIYVPSYFDFVELRHHFRTSEISCFMMCEYTDKGKKAQGRDVFYKGSRHFMLYTERTHFYFRHWIKGIQHLIFYKLPTYPKFFREICNSLMDSHPKRKEEERTCTVLVTPKDFLQLKHVVGLEEADRMLKSKQKTFVKYVGS